MEIKGSIDIHLSSNVTFLQIKIIHWGSSDNEY